MTGPLEVCGGGGSGCLVHQRCVGEEGVDDRSIRGMWGEEGVDDRSIRGV